MSKKRIPNISQRYKNTFSVNSPKGVTKTKCDSKKSFTKHVLYYVWVNVVYQCFLATICKCKYLNLSICNECSLLKKKFFFQTLKDELFR